MRNWFWAFVVLSLALISYSTWALVGAAELASTAQSAAPSALVQRIDLPSLRRSLAHQIVAAYLRQDEKLSKMSGMARGFAGSLGTTVADSMLQDLLTPESLATMLKDGRFGGEKAHLGTAVQVPRVSSIGTTQVLATVLNSYFDGPTSFVVPISGGAETYGVHLRLEGTTWMLSGLDMPASLVDRLAREVSERQKKSS